MKKPVYQMMREYRESTGMTQTHVAKKTGKAAQRISALENGSIRLTADELVDICVNGFGITPSNFFSIALSEIEKSNAEHPFD